jgi:methylmalonic aciduria homocystinuria type C protein
MNKILSAVTNTLKEKGFDLIKPFQVKWYNETVHAEHMLPTFNRPNTLGILIGNTKHFWPPFISQYKSNKKLQDSPHPIDVYTKEMIDSTFKPLLEREKLVHDIRYANEVRKGRLVSMQKISHVSGLAFLHPIHLSIHPVFGPWLALRAVVVIDTDGPKDEEFVELQDPVPQQTELLEKMLSDAMYASQDESDHEPFMKWIALRDAVEIGKEYKYEEDQLFYHYTKDYSILKKNLD